MNLIRVQAKPTWRTTTDGTGLRIVPFGLIKNDRLATKEEGAQIDAAMKAKEKKAGRGEEESWKRNRAKLDQEIENAKNGLSNNEAINKANEEAGKAAKAQEGCR